MSTKLIYYNNATAVCNNVLDGVAWQRYLSCERPRGAISFSDVVSQSMSEGLCWTDFIPPTTMDIKHFQCHNDVIDTCTTSDDKYDYSLQTETACKTLQSTFQVNTHFLSQIYANVHCFKCNTQEFELECFRYPTRSPFVQFTVLMNKKTIDEVFDTLVTALAKKKAPGQSADDYGRDYVRHPFKVITT